MRNAHISLYLPFVSSKDIPETFPDMGLERAPWAAGFVGLFLSLFFCMEATSLFGQEGNNGTGFEGTFYGPCGQEMSVYAFALFLR